MALPSQTAARSRLPPARRAPRSSYALESTRPLTILVFLAPLILLYELGSVRYLQLNGTPQTVKAWSRLMDLFAALGLAGALVPAASIVLFLLIWHVLSGQPWRIRTRALLTMAVESAAWACLLLLLTGLLRLIGLAPAMAPPAAGAPPGQLLALPWTARATISLGAGVYEEVLFRFVGISLFHLLLVDLCRLSHRTGLRLAIAATAVLFALYHDVAPAGRLDTSAAAYFFIAGVYFGTLFAARGLGIVAATHALFDLVVLVLLPAVR